MCGIFDVASDSAVSLKGPKSRQCMAGQRGKDSRDFQVPRIDGHRLIRSDSSITRLLEKVDIGAPGHVIDNGIVVNDAEIWSTSGREPHQSVDSEVIPSLGELSVCSNSRQEALALMNDEHLPRCPNLDAPAMCSPISNGDPHDLLAADRWFTHA